jgi:Putative Flp pilus-assembly TadE/G-like
VRPAAKRVDLADDRGSILPLIAGFGALALAVVLLVSAATSLYLERARLFTLADGAALSAAESFDLSSVRPTPEGELRPRLTDKQVVTAAADYLEQIPGTRLEGLRLVSATTPDGLSACVTLAAVWAPPVLSVFVPEGIPLEVTATSRSVFG